MSTNHEQSPSGRLRRWAGDAMRPGIVWHVLHTARLFLVNLRRNQSTQMAAALTYRTVFGLIPTLVIGLVLLAAFTKAEVQQKVISQFLTYAGLSGIKVTSTTPTNGAGEQQDAGAGANDAPEQKGAAGSPQAVDGARGNQGVDIGKAPSNGQAPGAGEDKGKPATAPLPSDASLEAWINKLAETVTMKIKDLPFNLISVVALATLIYAALGMLVEIEGAFNQVYKAPEGKSWVRRIIQYWTLLTLGPMLLVASFAVTNWVEGLARDTTRSVLVSNEGPADAPAAGTGTPADSPQAQSASTAANVVLKVVGHVGSALITTLALTILYVAIPNTRVMVTPALLGAGVAAVGWELGKFGFTSYLTYSTNYQQLYGAIAILPLFLLWVYVTWLIILTGLQLAYSMQTYRMATAKGLTESVLITLGLREDPAQNRKLRFVDQSAILTVMIALAERFDRGLTSDNGTVADRTGIDASAAAEVLERLAERGLLLRVEGTEREMQKYTLARPAGAILASEMLDLADEIASPAQRRPTALLDLLVRARREALGERTLADFVGRGGVPEAQAAAATAAAPGT
jgi:membrane protein